VEDIQDRRPGKLALPGPVRDIPRPQDPLDELQVRAQPEILRIRGRGKTAKRVDEGDVAENGVHHRAGRCDRTADVVGRQGRNGEEKDEERGEDGAKMTRVHADRPPGSPSQQGRVRNNVRIAQQPCQPC